MPKIIIDTDPGVDDAMALLFAQCHPELEVLGLTTIFGNVDVDLATTNTLRICEAAGWTVPVSKGESDALTGPPRQYPDWVHGKNGLGEIEWPEPSRQAHELGAVDFIAETVRKQPGEIILVPVGPLTNIAKLCQRHPDVIEQVKEVVIMGGSVNRGGIVTPYAEANVGNDPDGADIVFGANWKVTMIGIDVTMDTVVDSNDFAEIETGNKPFSSLLAKTADYYIDYYTKNMGVVGCCMHDVCATAFVIQPDLFGLTKAKISVDLEGETRGKTVVMVDETNDYPRWNDRPTQAYASTVDADAMRRLFVETLKG